MFDIIKKIIGSGKDEETHTGKNVPDANIALAVLLLEAAHVDGEYSDEEKSNLITTLTNKYKVAPEEIQQLLEAGATQRQESSDLFRFTRYMNNNLSREEKVSALEDVWCVLLIDDHLDSHEDHFVHKLANLLRLTHKDLIDAKLAARAKLRNNP